MTEKKNYVAPQVKAYQVKSQSIICLSKVTSSTEQLTEEDFVW